MARATTLVRSTAVAVALGMAVSVGAVGVTADAQVNYTENSPVVNPEATGSLTIHKYADPDSAKTPTGLSDQVVDGGRVLPGAGFTIYRITNIDVTTNEGLAAAAGISPNDYVTNGVVDTTNLEQVGVERITDDNGQIVLPEVELGAYLVVETTPVEGYTAALPFIAFVPMTAGNAEGEQGVSWFYDVHAYPKNYSAPEHVKTVKDEDQNVSQNVTYTVTGTVRQLAAGETLKQFRITDTIDDALQIDNITVAIAGSTDPLVEGTDYNQTGTGQNIDVNFTETGLAKLTSRAQVVMTVETTILDGVNAGEFYRAPNQAIVYQNNPGLDQDTEGQPTNEVDTYWGKLRFTKVDEAKEGLGGAEFRIVRSDDQCEDVDVRDQATIEANAVNGLQNGQVSTLFTSGTDGVVEVSGLHVNDFADNAEVDPADWYCLVEVKAPAGKELLPEPIAFQFVSTGTNEAGKRIYAVNQLTDDGRVVNKDDTTPLLPQTGGAGIALLVLAALGLIGGGAVYARRNTAQA